MDPAPKMIDVDQLMTKPAVPVVPTAPDAADELATLRTMVALMVEERSEVVAEKKAAKQRREISKMQMRAEIEKARGLTLARQAACNHTMPKGENSVFGQVHSDGKYHPICVVCQKEFAPRAPRGTEIETNVEMAM